MTRILIHDYGGYPFPLQLSRTLAARGHEVLHLYPAGFRTPKGEMSMRPSDPPRLRVEGVTLREPSHRDNFVARLSQERRYGRLIAGRISQFRPDVVISANTPLSPQSAALSAAHLARGKFVFWVQDLYSVAIRRLLGRRVPVAGQLISAPFEFTERRLLLASDAVIVITDEFLPPLARWHIPTDRVSVIENWAVIDEVVPTDKVNPWTLEHDIAHKPVLLYAGTLGRKHDPTLLVSLAGAIPEAEVVVVAEGFGADWLRRHTAGTKNLRLLPLQPAPRLSEVLASADVFLALLEADAAGFSVPSKILTYLAAGRPIVASLPETNLAAKTIKRAAAGEVVDSGDSAGFIAAARAFLEDKGLAKAAAEAGRRYALSAFDIETIADRFEAIMGRAIALDAFG